MIGVDTNVLVHAHRSDSEFHPAAVAALRRLAQGTAPWGLPWPCVHEFLAIVTHPRIFAPPTPLERALDQVDAWLESPTAVLLAEANDHWPRVRRALASSMVVGGAVHDARVAAVCLGNGVREFWTFDRDFSRFSELVTRSPVGGRER